MTSQEPLASILLDRSDASWYFFQNSSVGGPSSLDQLLRLSQQGHDGKETLICRTEFKKWYPLREISHLLKAHEDFERVQAEEIRQFQSFTDQHFESLEQLKNKTAQIPMRDLEKETYAIFEQPTKVAAEATSNVSITPARFSHYLLRGRLRLGAMKNSFNCAWIMMLLTLGLYWPFFLRRGFTELSWHVHNAFTPKRNAFFLTLSLIPVVHLIYAYRLAKCMREAEEQNGYRRTKPLWVACLAIIPPLAIFHLQRRMNYHWRLHVGHFNATMAQ